MVLVDLLYILQHQGIIATNINRISNCACLQYEYVWNALYTWKLLMADIKLQQHFGNNLSFLYLTFSKPKLNEKILVYLNIWLSEKCVSQFVNQYPQILPASLKRKIVWNNVYIYKKASWWRSIFIVFSLLNDSK